MNEEFKEEINETLGEVVNEASGGFKKEFIEWAKAIIVAVVLALIIRNFI